MKFTSTLLKQAWTLAKQVAGESSARPFFGWALKEVRLMTYQDTEKLRGERLEKREADEIRARMRGEIEGMGVAADKVTAAADYLTGVADIEILKTAEGLCPGVIAHVQKILA